MALVKFYAAARQFANQKEVQLTINNKLEFVTELHKLGDSNLTKLAQISTFLINGKRFSLSEISEINESDVIEMLPPFAGG